MEYQKKKFPVLVVVNAMVIIIQLCVTTVKNVQNAAHVTQKINDQFLLTLLSKQP
jgi:hypothetical protein